MIYDIPIFDKKLYFNFNGFWAFQLTGPVGNMLAWESGPARSKMEM